MAIGIGRMFGFRIRENFNFPYIATTIREFWRRWHISLSTWFRDYLYIPLGGNQRKPWRVYVNLVTVFFLCGLWHGASWNFVLWGMIHGLFIVAERIGFNTVLDRVWKPLRHVYAMLVVTVAWVFFRAETLAYATGYVKVLAGLGAGDGIAYYPELYLNAKIFITLGAGIVLSAPLYPYLKGKLSYLVEGRPLVYFPVKAVTLSALFLLSLLHVAATTYNPFIYFKF